MIREDNLNATIDKANNFTEKNWNGCAANQSENYKIQSRIDAFTKLKK
jgi:hypothetical protein